MWSRGFTVVVVVVVVVVDDLAALGVFLFKHSYFFVDVDAGY